MENFQQALNENFEKRRKEEWESIFDSVDSNEESAKDAVEKLLNGSVEVGGEVGYYFVLKSEIWRKGGEKNLDVFYTELQNVVNQLKSEGSYNEIAILRFLQEEGIEYDKSRISETINSVAERKDYNFINASPEYAKLISFAIKNNISFDKDVVKSFIGKRFGTYLEPLRNTDLVDSEVVKDYDSGKKRMILG